MIWKLGYKTMDFSKPQVMGVLNITPDSFSDGGRYVGPKINGKINLKKIISDAKQMITDGATILDVGGESSRPGSVPVSETEELRRVLPVIRELVKIGIIISIDTTKPYVADLCLEHGADIINDISGFRNKKMIAVVKNYKNNIGCIVMHMQGTPKTMQENIQYYDVVKEVYAFLKQQTAMLKKEGIKQIMIDPGIGFGKKVQHNILLIKNLNRLKDIKQPILIGASRKSFIGKITNTEVTERLPGTLAVNLIALQNGANVLRVHDVKEHVQLIRTVEAIKQVNNNGKK